MYLETISKNKYDCSFFVKAKERVDEKLRHNLNFKMAFPRKKSNVSLD